MDGCRKGREGRVDNNDHQESKCTRTHHPNPHPTHHQLDPHKPTNPHQHHQTNQPKPTSWEPAGTNDAKKHAFFAQIAKLHATYPYPGGLTAYIRASLDLFSLYHSLEAPHADYVRDGGRGATSCAIRHS